jgi:hypothetical protein
MDFECASTPQGIIQAIAVEDSHQRNRLIVGLGLAEGIEQLLPTFSAWIVFTDLV